MVLFAGGGTATGTLTGSSKSKLVIGGAAGTLRFTNSTDTLLNFTLNNNASATIGSNLDIAAGSNTAPGTLTIDSLATLNTGNKLKLNSNDSSTAIVTAIAENSSGIAQGNINGTVTVERRVHSGINTLDGAQNGSGNIVTNNGLRAWRLLTAPVTSTGSPNYTGSMAKFRHSL